MDIERVSSASSPVIHAQLGMDDEDQAVTANTENNTSSNTPLGSRVSRKCSRCRNHGLKVAQKGHSKNCKYRDCNCENCKVFSYRQTFLTRQAVLTKSLAQNEERAALSMDGLSLRSMAQSWRILEGSYDSNSGDSSFSHHGSTGTQDGNSDTTGIASSVKAPSVTGTDSKEPTKVPRTTPKCLRCRNHNVVNTLKGHKRYCYFRNCACPKCLHTVRWQKYTAQQTAIRRAHALDEERKLKLMGMTQEDPVTLSIKSKHLPKVPESAISLEGSHDSNIGSSPISNHSSNDGHGGISNIVTISPPKKLPPVHIGTPPSIRMPQTPPVDDIEVLVESSKQLLDRFQYPSCWEMLQLMYVILKHTGANLEEAAMRIIEAENDMRWDLRLRFWNTVRMIQSASTFCSTGYSATTGIIDAPTYEGQVPYIGVPPPPNMDHFKPTTQPLNAHIPMSDIHPKHPAT